jgi:hypothetical protein
MRERYEFRIEWVPLGKAMATNQDACAEVSAGAGSPNGNPANTAADPPSVSEDVDFVALLGNLSDAIAVVTVVHRSLEAKEIMDVGDEEVALRYAISLLQGAYTALDMASIQSSR